jgi:hypothetical protein
VDAAALFISIIGALGTGAAAIMAWTSRADALRAEAEARNAEAAALKTANDSADALREANRIAREQFGELREAERRRERARWAAKLRRWMTVKIAKAQTGSSRAPFASDPTFAELSALRAELGEPTAEETHAAVVADLGSMLNGVVKDQPLPLDLTARLTAWDIVLESWALQPTLIPANDMQALVSTVQSDVMRSRWSDDQSQP